MALTRSLAKFIEPRLVPKHLGPIVEELSTVAHGAKRTALKRKIIKREGLSLTRAEHELITTYLDPNLLPHGMDPLALVKGKYRAPKGVMDAWAKSNFEPWEGSIARTALAPPREAPRLVPITNAPRMSSGRAGGVPTRSNTTRRIQNMRRNMQ